MGESGREWERAGESGREWERERERDERVWRERESRREPERAGERLGDLRREYREGVEQERKRASVVSPARKSTSSTSRTPLTLTAPTSDTSRPPPPTISRPPSMPTPDLSSTPTSSTAVIPVSPNCLYSLCSRRDNKVVWVAVAAAVAGLNPEQLALVCRPHRSPNRNTVTHLPLRDSPQQRLDATGTRADLSVASPDLPRPRSFSPLPQALSVPCRELLVLACFLSIRTRSSSSLLSPPPPSLSLLTSSRKIHTAAVLP